MKGYSASEEGFKPFEQRLLLQATQLVDCIPETLWGGGPLRCHELARACGKFLNLPVADGRYGSVEHSWLWTRPLTPMQPGESPPNILDVYAVGRLPMVQLVDYSSHGPRHHKHYSFGSPRSDIDERVVARLIDLFNGTFNGTGKLSG
jgi:hypothetical protein